MTTELDTIRAELAAIKRDVTVHRIKLDQHYSSINEHSDILRSRHTTSDIAELNALRREYGPAKWLMEIKDHMREVIRDEMKFRRLPTHTGVELMASLDIVGDVEVTFFDNWCPRNVIFDIESSDESTCVTVTVTRSFVMPGIVKWQQAGKPACCHFTERLWYKVTNVAEK